MGGNERPECGWVSLWDGGLGGLFYPFGVGFLGQYDRRGCVAGRGGCLGHCGGDCGCGASVGFCLFPV